MSSTNEFKPEILNPVPLEILAAMQDQRQGTHTTISYLTKEEIKEKFNMDIVDYSDAKESLENHRKYFQPDISDIHVGYECEVYWCCPDPRIWVPTQVNENDQDDGYGQLSIEDIICRTEKREVRVPYLTKEQVEKEGWKYSDTVYTMDNNSVISYRKSGTDFIVIYIQATKYLMIKKNVPYGDKVNEIYVYQGECKDINTFRKICKLLGI